MLTFFLEGFPKPEMKVVINGSVIILHQQDFPKYCQATGNGNGKGHGNPFPEDAGDNVEAFSPYMV